jgi:Zn-dependent protease
MARRFGVRTPDVILLPIGGVARLERIPEAPRQELLIALAGPAVTVAIIVVLFVAEMVIGHSAGDVLRTTLATGRALFYGDPMAERMSFFVHLLVVNATVLAFNLIPAFPLDGGRILQCVLWGRSGDYRSATQVACWSGLITALVFAVWAFAANESLLLGLGIFVMFYSYYQLRLLDHGMEDTGSFGYDFSKGYGGFGPDEDAPVVKPRRAGPIKRWLQARRARKIQREASQRAADEARLDELLDKIGRLGKESLTPEEKRFMDRVSARYRNRP